jgi:hypothetical protein
LRRGGDTWLSSQLSRKTPQQPIQRPSSTVLVLLSTTLPIHSTIAMWRRFLGARWLDPVSWVVLLVAQRETPLAPPIIPQRYPREVLDSEDVVLSEVSTLLLPSIPLFLAVEPCGHRHHRCTVGPAVSGQQFRTQSSDLASVECPVPIGTMSSGRLP